MDGPGSGRVPRPLRCTGRRPRGPAAVPRFCVGSHSGWAEGAASVSLGDSGAGVTSSGASGGSASARLGDRCRPGAAGPRRASGRGRTGPAPADVARRGRPGRRPVHRHRRHRHRHRGDRRDGRPGPPPAAALVALAGRGLGRRRGLAFDDRVGQPLHAPARSTACCRRCPGSAGRLVGVAVGVEQRDDLDPQLPGLGDRDVLAVRVDDQQGLGQPGHVADAGQVALDLLPLAGERRDHLLASSSAPARRRGSCSSSSSRSSRLRIVRKLVSVPPSQRSVT